VQPRQRRPDVALRARRPEHLCGRRRARPDDRVEVLRARLLRPEELLAAEDELRLGGGQVCERVEGVGLRGARETGAMSMLQ
jgi:hypothetical protein